MNRTGAVSGLKLEMRNTGSSDSSSSSSTGFATARLGALVVEGTVACTDTTGIDDVALEEECVVVTLTLVVAFILLLLVLLALLVLCAATEAAAMLAGRGAVGGAGTLCFSENEGGRLTTAGLSSLVLLLCVLL